MLSKCFLCASLHRCRWALWQTNKLITPVRRTFPWGFFATCCRLSSKFLSPVVQSCLWDLVFLMTCLKSVNIFRGLKFIFLPEIFLCITAPQLDELLAKIIALTAANASNTSFRTRDIYEGLHWRPRWVSSCYTRSAILSFFFFSWSKVLVNMERSLYILKNNHLN